MWELYGIISARLVRRGRINVADTVSGKPLAGIGRNLYHVLVGLFSGAFRDCLPTFQGQIHENGARILRSRFPENRLPELAEIYTSRSFGLYSRAD